MSSHPRVTVRPQPFYSLLGRFLNLGLTTSLISLFMSLAMLIWVLPLRAGA